MYTLHTALVMETVAATSEYAQPENISLDETSLVVIEDEEETDTEKLATECVQEM